MTAPCLASAALIVLAIVSVAVLLMAMVRLGKEMEQAQLDALALERSLRDIATRTRSPLK